MRPSISFLIDENLPVDVAQVILEAGYDALYLASSSRRGANDYEIWELAAQEQRILITRDLDFPLPLYPRPLGLILVRVPDWYRRTQIGALVREFFQEFDLSRAIGHVIIVAPGRIPRSRRFGISS